MTLFPGEYLIRFSGTRDACEKFRSVCQREFGRRCSKVDKVPRTHRYTVDVPTDGRSRTALESLYQSTTRAPFGRKWSKLLTINLVNR